MIFSSVFSGTASRVEETTNEGSSTQPSPTPNGEAEARGPAAGWRHGLPPAYNQRARVNGDTPARSVQSDIALSASSSATGPSPGTPGSPLSSFTSLSTASNGRVAPGSGARPKVRAPRPAPAAPQVQTNNQVTSVTVAEGEEPAVVVPVVDNAASPARGN
jgi:hypothetical protein